MHSDGSYLLNRTDTAFHQYTHGYWLLTGDGGMISMHSISVMSIVYVRWLFVALRAMPHTVHGYQHSKYFLVPRLQDGIYLSRLDSYRPECYLRVREPC